MLIKIKNILKRIWQCFSRNSKHDIYIFHIKKRYHEYYHGSLDYVKLLTTLSKKKYRFSATSYYINQNGDMEVIDRFNIKNKTHYGDLSVSDLVVNFGENILIITTEHFKEPFIHAVKNSSSRYTMVELQCLLQIRGV